MKLIVSQQGLEFLQKELETLQAEKQRRETKALFKPQDTKPQDQRRVSRMTQRQPSTDQESQLAPPIQIKRTISKDMNQKARYYYSDGFSKKGASSYNNLPSFGSKQERANLNDSDIIIPIKQYNTTNLNRSHDYSQRRLLAQGGDTTSTRGVTPSINILSPKENASFHTGGIPVEITDDRHLNLPSPNSKQPESPSEKRSRNKLLTTSMTGRIRGSTGKTVQPVDYKKEFKKSVNMYKPSYQYSRDRLQNILFGVKSKEKVLSMTKDLSSLRQELQASPSLGQKTMQRFHAKLYSISVSPEYTSHRVQPYSVDLQNLYYLERLEKHHKDQGNYWQKENNNRSKEWRQINEAIPEVEYSQVSEIHKEAENLTNQFDDVSRRRLLTKVRHAVNLSGNEQNAFEQEMTKTIKDKHPYKTNKHLQLLGHLKEARAQNSPPNNSSILYKDSEDLLDRESPEKKDPSKSTVVHIWDVSES